jgi:pimeloyl-ACP methyl ester carboxylesterase
MQTQYFERPEGTLAYSDYGGGGELVLMLPGMGALRSEYRFLAPKLGEAGYRAVAADLRGHGESSVPWQAYDVPSAGNDILALIEHLHVGAGHVIATSFSAGAAVWAAAEGPDRIRSLVLIGAFRCRARARELVAPAVGGTAEPGESTDVGDHGHERPGFPRPGWGRQDCCRANRRQAGID